jgi:hypothetical protein
MADLTEVYGALKKADAAGDTAGAKQLADYIRAQSAAPAETPAAPAPAYGISDFIKDAASGVVRPVAKAMAALPLMAMDAGVGARNLITGSNYDLPSTMFNQSLDQYTRPPDSTLGKVAETASSMVAGGIMGGNLPKVGQLLPQPSAQMFASDQIAPSNFVKPAQALRQQALPVAERNGLVVPPSQSNPTFTNRLYEGIGGKLKLNQEAMQANQPQFTRMAAEELGQNPEAPLSQGALSSIRQEAVQKGYAPIRDIGTITPGPKYTEALDKIVQASQGASKSFPGIKAPDIEGIVSPLRQSSFDSGDAVDAISVLRGQADEAYTSGQKQAGKAFKSAAKALEDAIEQHLVDQGDSGADMLGAYRAARTQIAKSIDVGKALNDATGQVNAIKLAGIAAKSPGRLSGNLADIATFARAYPKVSREVTDIFPSVSPLDMYGSAMASAASGSPAPLAYPLTRVALRNYLLSPAGQARAIPKVASQSLGVLDALPKFNPGLMGLSGQ